MIYKFLPTSMPGGGLYPSEHDPIVTNKSGGTMSPGDCVAFDIYATGSGVTSVDPGGTVGASIYNCVVAPVVATTVLHGYFGIVLVGGIVGTEIKVRVFGLVQNAFIIYSAGSAAIGDPLIATAAKNLDGVTATANAKVLAHSRAVVTTPSTRTLAPVDFDGICGFGNRA